jgi:tRNA-Thr(GGU) m(6)t(6)A37 methyltransferase TsaA
MAQKEKQMNHTSSNRKAETFRVSPVGYVRRQNGRTVLDILPAFVPALKELENFSHVQVIWWFSQFEDDVHRQTTRFADAPFDAPVLGVFACRAPTRPNPIGLTTAKIIHVDHEEGHVEIADIDAYDGTPILDLKAYLPVCDRVQDMRVPSWAADWPQWLPEGGLGLED